MGDQAIPAGGLLDIPDSIETPSLVVDRARMERNIADMAAYAAGRGIGLAPHAKTHRTPEIARLQMAAGAEMLCIAKLGEAEVLADAGLDSFVMAYPIVGDAKIARARRLMRRASILLSVDSFAGAEALGAGMAAEGAVADVLVITDTGYHRCGVAAAEAVDFAAAVAPLPGVRLRGLITHEGHAYSKPGEEGLHNASVDAGQAMVDAAADLRARGLEIDVVSVGSSATARTPPPWPASPRSAPASTPSTTTARCCAAWWASTAAQPAWRPRWSATPRPTGPSWTPAPSLSATTASASTCLALPAATAWWWTCRAGSCTSSPRSTAGCAGPATVRPAS